MVSFKYIIIADEWLEGSENGTESIKNHMHCQCLTLFHFGVICVVDLDTIPERYIFEVVFFFNLSIRYHPNSNNIFRFGLI